MRNLIMLRKIDKKIEEYVTYKVTEYLDNDNWKIISCNPPGSHGGICLLDKNRSKGGIVPDIIARRKDYILIVESKPFYSAGVLKDIKKLDGINTNHISNLTQRLGFSDKWLENWQNYVQKAIAIKKIEQEEIDKIPKSYIIFVANEKGENIQIIIGEQAIIKKLE